MFFAWILLLRFPRLPGTCDYVEEICVKACRIVPDSVQTAASNRRLLTSDAVGILVIGIQVYWVVRWLVPDAGSRLTLGILAVSVLTGLALYFWHKEPPMEHLSSPGEWALAIPMSVLIGAVSFGIDVLVGLISNPNLPPIKAGTKAGSPFGFVLTVMICPGFTMLAVAGLLRALVLRTDAAGTSQR